MKLFSNARGQFGCSARQSLRTLAMGLAAAAPVLSHAALTDNIAVDPVAMSLANACTADPPGIASIHFNPAGLALITTDTRSDGIAFASIREHETFNSAPDLDLGGFTNDPINGTSSGPTRQVMTLPFLGLQKWHLPAAVVPGLGFAWHEPGSSFTFGTANYIPMAYTVDRTKMPNDPADYDGKVVDLQRLVYVSPSVGYKVSKTLSVGVSVPIAYVSMALNTDMRLPNPFLGAIGQFQQSLCSNGPNAIDALTLGLCQQSPTGNLNPFTKAANFNMFITAPMDPTVNLGILWQPSDQFALGAVYQSGTNTVFHGTYEFDTEPMLPAFVKGMNESPLGIVTAAILGMPSYIPPVQKGNMVANIPFPYHVQLGLKVKPFSFLQLNADIAYSDWSKWSSLTMQFDQQINLLEMAHTFGVADASKLTLPMGMKSVVNYSFGVQSAITDKLTLRAGYEPRKSSEPENVLSLIAPLPDTKYKSLGFSYKTDGGGEFSFGAAIISGHYNIPARTDCNLNCDNFTNVIYNPYAATNVNGDIYIRYAGIRYSRPF